MDIIMQTIYLLSGFFLQKIQKQTIWENLPFFFLFSSFSALNGSVTENCPTSGWLHSIQFIKNLRKQGHLLSKQKQKTIKK